MSRSELLATSSFNQLAEIKDGYCLYNRNDRFVGRSIAKYGEYSSREVQLLCSLLAPGAVVVEVGANIGTHTIALARQVGAQGRVLAFEPQRVVYQMLCANVALNSLENVDCYWLALGETACNIGIPELDPNVANNFGGVAAGAAGASQQIHCSTLDSLAWLPQVQLVKIDVEGMEAEVIAGGMQLISQFKPLLYVENDRPEKSAALMRLIDSLDYRMSWDRPPLFNPDNYYGEPENIFPNLVSFNMLCIHRDAPVSVEGFSEIADFSHHPMRR